MTSRRFALALLLLASCSVSIGEQQQVDEAPGRDRDSIVVASFDFDESEVLAELYATVLEERGYEVARSMRLGPREIVQPALQQGIVDLVPEYAGSAFEFLTLNDRQGAIGSDLRTRLSTLLAVEGIAVLEFAPAQDRNSVVVPSPTAERHGLRAISDLDGLASDFILGGPPECPERPLCMPGLEEVYGLRFEGFVPLTPGAPVVAALTASEIDAAIMFSTDPNILTYQLVLLKDDRRLQPRENVVPMLRKDVLGRYGAAVEDVINAVSERLTTVVVRSLNRQMSSGLDAHAVALGWLRTEGLVE